MTSVASSVIRLRRRGRGEDSADLPIHRWVDDHALDLLEGPETSNWRPETTNWVREILWSVEQHAQERNGDSEQTLPIELRSYRDRRQGHAVEGGLATSEDADVAYWAYAIREMLKDIHCEVDGIEGAPLFT